MSSGATAAVARAVRLARPDVRELVLGASPGHRKVAKFCVYCTGRTGSELLTQLLSSHPSVVCDSEILAQPRLSSRLYVLGRATRAARAGASVYGFKLVNEHFRWTRPAGDSVTFVNQLAADGFEFVRLRRHNVLRQALSHLRAQATGTYHAVEQPADRQPLYVDPVELIYLIRHLEVAEHISDLILDGIDTVPLWYEDHLETDKAQAATAEMLWRRFGVSSATPRVTVHRLASSELRNALANYDDVAAALSRTRYRDWL